MNICTLYKDFKEYRKTRKENDGAVACRFIPLVGEPWTEILKPDKDGWAINKKGRQIIIDPHGKNIFGESLPQKLK